MSEHEQSSVAWRLLRPLPSTVAVEFIALRDEVISQVVNEYIPCPNRIIHSAASILYITHHRPIPSIMTLTGPCAHTIRPPLGDMTRQS